MEGSRVWRRDLHAFTEGKKATRATDTEIRADLGSLRATCAHTVWDRTFRVLI